MFRRHSYGWSAPFSRLSLVGAGPLRNHRLNILPSVGEAKNITEFRAFVKKAPLVSLRFHLERGDFLKWLMYIKQPGLAARVRKLKGDSWDIRGELSYALSPPRKKAVKKKAKKKKVKRKTTKKKKTVKKKVKKKLVKKKPVKKKKKVVKKKPAKKKKKSVKKKPAKKKKK